MNQNIDNASLNILIVSEVFFPDSEGGAHTYVYHLARSLLSRGHQVSLITIKAKAELKDKEVVDGINVYRYSVPLKGRLIYLRRPLISAWRAWLIFEKITSSNNFDILNIHSVLPAVCILKSSAAKKKAKVFTFHASMYQEIIAQKAHKKYTSAFMLSIILKIIKWLEKYVLGQCERIIVLSRFSRKQLVDLYSINQDKIKVVAGAIDTSKFTLAQDKDSVRRQFNLPVEKIILLCVRRLVARMGLENLIEAVEYLKEDSVNFMLYIGGRGYLENKLKKLIKDKNLGDHIKLLGFIHNDDLPRHYRAADLFILPTKELEGFGLVTLESLSSGVPVLGTSVGGTKEIISKLDKRFFFANLEPKAMSIDIKRVIEIIKKEPSLPNRCRKLILDNYSWNEKVKEIEFVFKNAIKEKIIKE